MSGPPPRPVWSSEPNTNSLAETFAVEMEQTHLGFPFEILPRIHWFNFSFRSAFRAVVIKGGNAFDKGVVWLPLSFLLSLVPRRLSRIAVVARNRQLFSLSVYVGFLGRLDHHQVVLLLALTPDFFCLLGGSALVHRLFPSWSRAFFYVWPWSSASAA